MLNNWTRDKKQSNTITVSTMLLLTAVLLPLPIFAEETEAEDSSIEIKTAEDQKMESKPKAEVKTDSKAKSRPSEREFDPSEEISEDLSVPFPVDI